MVVMLTSAFTGNDDVWVDWIHLQLDQCNIDRKT